MEPQIKSKLKIFCMCKNEQKSAFWRYAPRVVDTRGNINLKKLKLQRFAASKMTHHFQGQALNKIISNIFLLNARSLTVSRIRSSQNE